jgi:hypothetical protein
MGGKEKEVVIGFRGNSMLFGKEKGHAFVNLDPRFKAKERGGGGKGGTGGTLTRIDLGMGNVIYQDEEGRTLQRPSYECRRVDAQSLSGYRTCGRGGGDSLYIQV